MKLFHFNPNGYGQEYFVMAVDKSAAIEALLNFLKKKAEESVKPSNTTSVEEDRLAYMEKVLMNGVVDHGYTIDEYVKNEVVQSEVA